MAVTDQLPSVARIVHYRLSAEDVSNINFQRTRLLGGERGNAPREGDVLPLIVAAVYAEYKSIEAPSVVNGQVILDGPDTLWVTSRKQGDENGQWSWPPRV